MLSKKQARAFFLGGTVVTFLIFIGLTIFSFSKGQDQTNHEPITEQVVRGKVLWEENNCMGCHTILGEGAYYAPELLFATNVWTKSLSNINNTCRITAIISKTLR